jgi:hypothetical protein
MDVQLSRLVAVSAALSRGLGTVVAVAASLSMVSIEVAAQSAAAAVQPADAGSVARALVDAMKANDGARIRALFAPDASQAYGDSKPKSGPAFFAWLESDIIERKGPVDNPQFAVNGNEVIVTGQFRNSRGYRSAANFRIVVDNGRIASWQMRY